MTMGFFHAGTRGVMPLTMTGARNTVPSILARMVALGLAHIFLSPNSSTLCALGVMVAHLTPTPSLRHASAASTVTLSSVASRFSRERS